MEEKGEESKQFKTKNKWKRGRCWWINQKQKSLRNVREGRMGNTGERLSGSYNRNLTEILSPWGKNPSLRISKVVNNSQFSVVLKQSDQWSSGWMLRVCGVCYSGDIKTMIARDYKTQKEDLRILSGNLFSFFLQFPNFQCSNWRLEKGSHHCSVRGRAMSITAETPQQKGVVTPDRTLASRLGGDGGERPIESL